MLSRISVFRFMVLAVFPLGWMATKSIFAQGQEYYFALNLVALLAAFAVIRGLQGNLRRCLHLWVIFLICLVGYFIKYYLLCFMSTDLQEYGDFLYAAYPREAHFLTDAEFLLSYFELVTAVLVCLAVLVHVLRRMPAKCTSTVPAERLAITQWARLRHKLPALLGGVILLSMTVFAIEWTYGIGVLGGEESTEPPLPFRLAGVVAAIHNGLLPLAFLVIIWLTDQLNMTRVNRYAVAAYIGFGLIGGILTTSKAALVSIVVSLLVLWLVVGRLTRGRLLVLVAMLPLTAVFSILLSVSRTLRGLGSDQGITDVLVLAWDQLLPSGAPREGDGLPRLAGYVGFLLRINGADSLLNIIDHAPVFYWDRALDLLFSSEASVTDLYAIDVLNVSSLIGVAFSPSLLGYLYFVFPGLIGVCAGFVAYVFFWHWLCTQVLRLRLSVEPVMLSLLAIMLAHFTSEGTLDALPIRIGLFLVAVIFGEWMLRRVLGTRHPTNSWSKRL